MTVKVDVKQLSVAFTGTAGTVTAIDRLSLSVAPGEFVAIVGPSGCGKSTLLRVIAGLVDAAAGQVSIDGSPVTEPPPGVGFMFQRDTLLPWATVAENISVGCELSAMAPADYPRRVAELIDLIKLNGFESHYPGALSGGMRQRVSLARLLAYEPQLYLMDEPFGALDYQTKIVMGHELLRVWETRKRSIVFVTHDIEEAVTLADRVIVMSARPGRIVQDYRIDLPRPREPRALRGNPEFSRLCGTIWGDLEQTSGEALS